MEPLFKKILSLNVQGKGHKNQFICRCIVNSEEGQNFCSMKFNTFKGVVRHLIRHHQLLIPNEIVCFQCESLFSSMCQLLDHYRIHIETGSLIFNQEHDDMECLHCKSNLNCIRMCRASTNCAL